MFKGKLTISVKEGSMVPKDDMTRRNEAIDLWQFGAIDPITLYDKLEYPDPTKSARDLFLWQNAPQMLFSQQGGGLQPTPDQQAQMQQQQAPGGGQQPGQQAQPQPQQQLGNGMLQQVPIQ